MRLLSLAFGMVAFTFACSEPKKDTKSSGDAQGSVGTGTGTAGGASNQVVPNDGYFTGIDGKNDYSLLIPGFRTLTIADTSIAKIEQIKVKLPEATVNELVEARKKSDPNFDAVRFKSMLERETSAYKITPLKAGRTVIKSSGGRGGEAGRGQRGWGKSKDIDLVITQFTEAQFEAGKKRYETDGAGTLKACKSCHEKGEQGAPPHELGEINSFNDTDALAWFKTGQAKGRTAKIEHKWGFSSDDEEKGIVAFMRSKQTNDIEGLTKLIMEERIANGFAGPGGPRP